MAESHSPHLAQSLSRSIGLAGGAVPAIDIVVPAYNAYDELLACLESVARQTTVPHRLIVVNDGSTDPRVGGLLDEIAGAAQDLITINRADNRGFVTTVNEAMALSDANDVVLLNSDTVVTRDWLTKLQAVSRRQANVATVTPLTNNGTICSVPEPRGTQTLPDGYDVDSFAALVEETSWRLFPAAPTGVGFCMLITRAALDAVGVFDDEAFPRGYGEENDFCQRAIQAGFVNLIADDTFVFHAGGASFGATTAAHLQKNLRTLVRRHPRYLFDVDRFQRAHPLRRYVEQLRERLAAERGTALPQAAHENQYTSSHTAVRPGPLTRLVAVVHERGALQVFQLLVSMAVGFAMAGLGMPRRGSSRTNGHQRR